MTSRLVVVGSGGFAVNCLEAILQDDAAKIALVVTDPRAKAMRGLLQRRCADRGLPIIESTDLNSAGTLAAIRAERPDYVISCYNMQILRRELLGIPRFGTVNFHNGPLPRYRGVNVYSWAIINGESEYGVTWHLVDEGIDSGPILIQRMFQLSPNERPTTLLAKGFEMGVECLADMLPALLAGRLTARPQDEALATYYSRRDLPNGGWIDWEWPWERLDRFFRGLDYRPLPNSFVYPTTALRGTVCYPQTLRRLDDSREGEPGEIVDFRNDALAVQAADGAVALSDILGPDHKPISLRDLRVLWHARRGDRLDRHDRSG